MLPPIAASPTEMTAADAACCAVRGRATDPEVIAWGWATVRLSDRRPSPLRFCYLHGGSRMAGTEEQQADCRQRAPNGEAEPVRRCGACGRSVWRQSRTGAASCLVTDDIRTLASQQDDNRVDDCCTHGHSTRKEAEKKIFHPSCL